MIWIEIHGTWFVATEVIAIAPGDPGRSRIHLSSGGLLIVELPPAAVYALISNALRQAMEQQLREAGVQIDDPQPDEDDEQDVDIDASTDEEVEEEARNADSWGGGSRPKSKPVPLPTEAEYLKMTKGALRALLHDRGYITPPASWTKAQIIASIVAREKLYAWSQK